MTEREALELLQKHNRWRRGDDSVEMANPSELGRAIDVACRVLSEHIHEKEKTNDSTNRPQRKGRRV